MNSNEVKKLVVAAEAKDNGAMEALYKEFYTDVVYICRKYNISEEDSKDIAQETFIKAFSQLGSLKDKSKFKQWICKIAHNKCMDLLRHNNVLKFESTNDNETILEIPDKQKNVEDIVVEKETEQMLMSVIEKLPVEQRVTVFLFFYEDYSVKEIASLYNCSENTVRSRLNYAKKFMIKEIEKMDESKKNRCIILLPFLYVLFANERETFACEIPDSTSMIANVMKEKPKGSLVKIGIIGVASAAVITGAVIGIGALVKDRPNDKAPTNAEKNVDKLDKEDSSEKENVDDESNSNPVVDKIKERLDGVAVMSIGGYVSCDAAFDSVEYKLIDVKNGVFEDVDGWYGYGEYVVTEADGKMYKYIPNSNNTVYIKELHCDKLIYSEVMANVLDTMVEEGVKEEEDKKDNKKICADLDARILDNIAKYFGVYDKISKIEGNVTVKVEYDDNYLVTGFEICSEQVAKAYEESYEGEQLEQIIRHYGTGLDLSFAYDYEDVEAPSMSDEISELTVPGTISVTYTDHPALYTINFGNEWEENVIYNHPELNNVLMSVEGMINGYCVKAFFIEETDFENRRSEYTKDELEKMISGGDHSNSDIFISYENEDINLTWTQINGMDVAYSNSPGCSVEAIGTLAVVKLNLGDEERALCISIEDYNLSPYEPDTSGDARVKVLEDIVSSLTFKKIENPRVDRSDFKIE